MIKFKYCAPSITYTYSNTDVDNLVFVAQKNNATRSDDGPVLYARGQKMEFVNSVWKTWVNTVASDMEEIEETVAEALTDFDTRLTSAETSISGKQATLVSGTNIKTVNNTSLLGSGNISISGGDTNVIETVKVNGTALTPDANKAVNVIVPDSPVCIETSSVPTSSTTTYTVDGVTYNFKVGDMVKFDQINNVGQYRFFRCVNLTASNNTTTALWEELNHENHNRVYSTSGDSISLTTQWIPYYFYRCGTMTSISFNSTVFTPYYSNNHINEWKFSFKSGSTATTLSLPNTIIWNEELTVEANTYYEISILYDPATTSLYGMWASWPL